MELGMKHVWMMVLCTPAVLLGLIGSARSETSEYGRKGGYIGVSAIGASYTRFDDELEDQLEALGYFVSLDTDEAAGFNVYGGYRFHRNFSIEGEFEMLPNADISVSGIGDLAELRTWALTANAKAFPFSGRAQPYVLFGIGVMEGELEDSVGAGLSVTETDFAVRFGGGLDFYLTPHFLLSIGVDYMLPTGDVEDLDYVAFGGGVQYRF